MTILNGFIAVMGIVAIAIAFAVLSAAAGTIPGIVLASVGALAVVGSIISQGFFAYQNKSFPFDSDELALQASSP